MSWVITGKEAGPADPFIGSVSLLLHGDGTNGSTTFTDNSPSPKTVTAFGNAQISTVQSKFGGASILLDGTGDYLVPSDEPSFNLSTGDFTLEAWVYPTASKTAMAVASKRGNAGDCYRLTLDSGTLLFTAWQPGGIVVAANLSGGSVSLNTWTHIAAVRSGATFSSFLNGALQQTATYSGSLANFTATDFAVGRELWTTTRDYQGYIDDLRITKGVARYTANFTPPTAPFPDI